MEPTELNDLPDLAFEKILGHLGLLDRIKCRAVSIRWKETIDSFKPNSLCYSRHPRDFIFKKSRWVSGPFAQNFVSSARLDLFLPTLRRSIFTSLKHLRLFDLGLKPKHVPAFTQTLNSLGQLEKLDIIRFGNQYEDPNRYLSLELNLPMLNSILLEDIFERGKLTLDAPKLKNVKFLICAYRNLYL